VRHPTFDFETRSAAGFVWNEEDECWEGPPGAADSGLDLVGVENYVAHPTFKVLCLSYDLLDGEGVAQWTPWSPNPPTRLLRHIALHRPISGWNVAFERKVWNLHCVKAYGWPEILLDQCICDMAIARAWTMPASLGNAGDVLNLDIVKDKSGKALIKKFTVPRQPTKANQAIWNEPDDPDGPPPKPKKTKLMTPAETRQAMTDYFAAGRASHPSPYDDDIPF
jgi:hypothetical protein